MMQRRLQDTPCLPAKKPDTSPQHSQPSCHKRLPELFVHTDQSEQVTSRSDLSKPQPDFPPLPGPGSLPSSQSASRQPFLTESSWLTLAKTCHDHLTLTAGSFQPQTDTVSQMTQYLREKSAEGQVLKVLRKQVHFLLLMIKAKQHGKYILFIQNVF